MISLYVDESGSMTTDYSSNQPYFVIAIVRSMDSKELKSSYKRYVKSHFTRLLDADKRSRNSRMFRDGKFIELKGSQFTPELKLDFLEYFCYGNMLEIYYVIIDNRRVRPRFYNNTARAFNYVIKNLIISLMKRRIIPDDDIYIQLDERNERTETKHFLENYLRTELCDSPLFSHDIHVRYFDSAQNHLIQIADVFANIMYSELRTNTYTDEINYMEAKGYLKFKFEYPLE